jgi:hypothetical protein
MVTVTLLIGRASDKPVEIGQRGTGLAAQRRILATQFRIARIGQRIARRSLDPVCGRADPRQRLRDAISRHGRRFRRNSLYRQNVARRSCE